MLPLEPTNLLRSSWRVTISDLRSGIAYVTDQHAADRYNAVSEALRETEARHPELDEIGVTHSVTRVERIERA